jgi:hypothetical protein
MKSLERIEAQLDRVLGFFPRVDTKMGGIFAVNSAMLTICALNIEAQDLTKWYIVIPGILVLLGLATSNVFLYRCNFPELQGGQGSLIYFTAIQNRTEINYRDEFEAASEEAYRSDLLGQIWRNSSILCQKYKSLAAAIRSTLITLIPFGFFLVMTAVDNSRFPVLRG